MSISATTVKQLMAEMGADLYGIASVTLFTDAPKGFHPQDVFSECKSVVVMASAWPKASLHHGNETYTMVRDLMANKMDLMATALASALQAKGVASLPVRFYG